MSPTNRLKRSASMEQILRWAVPRNQRRSRRLMSSSLPKPVRATSPERYSPSWVVRPPRHEMTFIETQHCCVSARVTGTSQADRRLSADQGSYLLASDHTANIAAPVQVEDDHWQVIVLAEANRSSVHHLQTPLDNFHV